MPERSFVRASLACLVLLVPYLSCSSTCQAEPITLSLPANWTAQSAQELLDYIQNDARTHGLDPAAYGPDALRRAVTLASPRDANRASDQSFRTLARDLLRGVVPINERPRAHFTEPDTLQQQIDAALTMARATGQPGRILDSLAPRHWQYRVLRDAMERTDLSEDRDLRLAIAINLERWRWLPRNLGERHIVVNIPEYSLALIEGDGQVARHRAIVGKLATPTPQFAARVDAVILNPIWSVPQSIIAESVGRLIRTDPRGARARGYTWSRDAAGRLRVVQQPGSGNALGVVKLDMPNRFTVYAHDTPSKQLFAEDIRTFSHGCIRVDDAVGLAKQLLGPAGWQAEEVDTALAGGGTRRIPLPSPVPVYIVYLTVVAGPDGEIDRLEDPYGLDDDLAVLLAPGVGGQARPLSGAGSNGGCL